MVLNFVTDEAASIRAIFWVWYHPYLLQARVHLSPIDHCGIRKISSDRQAKTDGSGALRLQYQSIYVYWRAIWGSTDSFSSVKCCWSPSNAAFVTEGTFLQRLWIDMQVFAKRPHSTTRLRIGCYLQRALYLRWQSAAPPLILGIIFTRILIPFFDTFFLSSARVGQLQIRQIYLRS